MTDSVLATIDGRFEEVQKLSELVLKRRKETNLSGATALLSLPRVNIYLGIPIDSIVSDYYLSYLYTELLWHQLVWLIPAVLPKLRKVWKIY